MRIFWVEILAIFLCVVGDVRGVCEVRVRGGVCENAILGWMGAMN